MPRPCIDCRAITQASRCPACRRRHKARRNADAPAARAAVRAHIAEHGPICPGWQRLAHPSTDLTADHLVAFADGGTLADGHQVLCRSCNASRGRR